MSTHYKVLFNDYYGGFRISRDGFLKIYEKFPEKREKYNWDKNYKSCLEKESSKKIYDFVRDDQEIIEYMIEEGLKSFSEDLGVEEIHNLCRYKIEEYDGMETVIPTIPFNKILEDLLSYINDKDYKDFKSEISKELLFGKGLVFLKELWLKD